MRPDYRTISNKKMKMCEKNLLKGNKIHVFKTCEGRRIKGITI